MIILNQLHGRIQGLGMQFAGLSTFLPTKAQTLETKCDHCLIGHASREPGHRRLCDAFGKEPILALDMALGEGSGAALALSILRGAVACHSGMATFAEAGVAGG